jgi:hypothetical protein
MMSANFTVKKDNNGVFTGFQQGTTTYTVAQWSGFKSSKPTTQP